MSDVGSARSARDLEKSLESPLDDPETRGEADLPPRGPAANGSLMSVLEERVGGLVDRYRGAQKSADELRSRLDAAEAELSALHARVEEAERLRGALRERVQSLIDQVERLEAAAAESEESEE